MLGTVKWFNNKKGFGFIIDTETKKEYFVHFSNIIMEGYKSLKEKQKIEFDLKDNEKGPMAVNVKPIIEIKPEKEKKEEKTDEKS